MYVNSLVSPGNFRVKNVTEKTGSRARYGRLNEKFGWEAWKNTRNPVAASNFEVQSRAALDAACYLSFIQRKLFPFGNNFVYEIHNNRHELSCRLSTIPNIFADFCDFALVSLPYEVHKVYICYLWTITEMQSSCTLRPLHCESWRNTLNHRLRLLEILETIRMWHSCAKVRNNGDS